MHRSDVRRNARRILAVSTAAAAVACLLGPGAGRSLAATDTYNSTGSADGLWDTATNWVPVPAGAAHKPTSLEDAIFVGPPPAAGRQITLSSGEVANSLRFSDEYVLTGGDLTLTTGNITVDNGLTYPYPVGSPSSPGLVPPISFNNATITSSLLGSAGLTKLGGGTLFLSGVNTFGGSGQSVTISGGRLGIISDAALGNAANSITLDGGALWLDENVTFGRAVTVTANGGTIDVSNGKTASYVGPGFVLAGGASTATTLTKTGLGTLDISSPNAFAGTIVLATNGGTLRLIGDSGTLAAPTAGSFSSAAGIVINPSSTLAIDNQNNFGPFTNFQSLAAAGNTDRLGNAIPITMNGGSLTYTAANGTTAASIRETIGAVTLNAGASTLGVTAFTGTGTTSLGGELELTSLTRSLGTTVNFNINGATPGAAGNNGRILIDSGTLSGTGGLIGGWATINNVDFAGTTTFSTGVVSVGVVSGTGAYDSGNTAASFASGKNTNLGADLTLPAGTTTTGSLRLNGTTARNLLFTNPTDVLNIESGGLLADGNNQARNIGSTATRGILTAGGASPPAGGVELFVHASTGTFTINSVLQNNTSSHPLTLIKDQGGTLALTAPQSTYTGGTILLNSGDVSASPTINDVGVLGFGPVTINNSRLLIVNNSSAVNSISNPNAWNITNRFTYNVTNSGSLHFSAGGALPNDFNTGLNQQTVRLTGGSELAISSVVTGSSLIFGGAGQDVVADPGSVLAETGAGFIQGQVTGLGATPSYFFGIEGTLTENIAVGNGTPWLGLSSGRGGTGTYSGGTTANTISYNSDFALQSFLANGAFKTLQIGNGTGATNVVQILPGSAASAKAEITGSVTLNNDQSTYQGVTFDVTPGSTLLLNTATALGGGSNGTTNAGTAAAIGRVIVEAGATLNLNGGIANAINGNVTFEPGSTFQADDTLFGGTLQGTGTLTFLPGSYITLSGNAIGTVNALTGTQIPTIPAGVIVRLNGNTNTANGVASIGAIGLAAKIQPNQVFEAINGGTNTITVAPVDGTPANIAAANLNLSGAVLTSNVTGGTINQGGGRIVVGTGGVTLAGGASISPPNASNGSATFSLQEDFDLPASGRTLTIGSNGTIDGQTKFGSYVALTGQGSRSVAGGIVDVTNGSQLQLSAFYTIPDLATLTIEPGTSVLINTNGVIETIGALTGSGSVANNQGAGTLQVGFGDQTSQFDGIFAAANTVGIPFATNQPSLNKIGSGTLTLTNSSTSTGTLTTIGGNTILTGASGTVKFGTITLGRGTLTLDNTGGIVPNRLGGTVSTGPTLNFAGGDLVLAGGGSETVNTVNYNLGGVSNVDLRTGTLTALGNTGRSISTVLLHGTKLGAGGAGNAAFTVNNAQLAGTAAVGTITTGVRSDILTDSNPAGGTFADPALVTYDATANSYRALSLLEMTSNVYAGQNVNNNIFLTAGSNTATAFPASGGIPGQLPSLGVDTTFQSLTMGNGSSIAQGSATNALGGRTRLNINGSAVNVQAGGVNGGSATITAPYLSGAGFIYVNDAGGAAVNSLTINSTLVNGSGTSAIVKAGAGTLTFGAGAINFYDQSNFAVNAGTLALQAGNSLFFNGTTAYALRNVWLAGGTLDLGGNGQVVGNLTSSNTLSQPLNNIPAGNIVSTGGNADIVTAGNSSFFGTISGIGNLTREGNSTTNFRNTVAINGDLTSRGGTLIFQDLGKITGANNVVMNVSSLILDNVDSLNFNQKPDFSGSLVTDRIPSNVPVVLRGSQLRFRSAPGVVDSQTFGATGDLTTGGTGTGLRLDAGANEILAEANGNASANVTIPNLVHPANSHAFANFTGSNIGNTGELYQVSHFTVSNINGAALANSGATGTANSIIAPWAIVAGGDFATYSTASFNSAGATVNSRGIGALGNTANGYSAYSAKAFNAVTGTTATTTAADIIQTGGSTDVAGVTARTIGALRLNNGNNAATLALNTPELLTVAGGGIIANTNNTMSITGGTITSGYQQAGGASNELYLWTNQNVTTLSSGITDNSTTPVTFIKAGAGSLVLNGTNSFTGGAYFSQGTTTLSGSGVAIPNSQPTLAVPDLTLTGNISTATVLIANTNAQIASGAKAELDGFATLRLNDTASGVTVLGGLTFNNFGGTAAPLVQIANTIAGGTLQLTGNVTSNNFNVANVPTIAQNLATAGTTLAVTDLGGATRTFDIEGQTAVGSAYVVNGESVLGLNLQTGLQNGAIIKTGAGTLGLGVLSGAKDTNGNLVSGANVGTVTSTGTTVFTGQYSISQLTGGITINSGVVRIDSPGALGASGASGNTTTVNPTGVLLTNINSANVFGDTNAPAAPTTVTGNITLAGGTLQAINSTSIFDGNISVTASSTIAEQDFFYTGVVNRSLTLAGPVAVSGTPTINVTAAAFAGSQGTLLLSNVNNNLTGAIIAIAPNAIVTAKPATPFTANPILGAAITMAGGQLNVAADGTNPVFGNNVTVNGPATITADRASASSGQTLSMGNLTLGAGYQLLTTSANNSYTLSFTGTAVPSGPLNLNVTAGTVNFGPFSGGTPTALNKFGAGTQLVTSWTSLQTLAPNAAVNINQGLLRTTSGNNTTALTSGPLNILYNGTLYNDSGSTNKVTYAPSSLSSQGLIQSHTGNMNLSGYLLQNANQTASLSPEFSNVSERWFNTLGANSAADDVLITLHNSATSFLNQTPSTTGVLKDQFLDFTDVQARARGRTTTNLMGAVISGTFTPTVTGPASFGLNTDDGSTLYLNWDNPGNGLNFTASDLIVSDLGAHAATVATGATPLLTAGVAYPFAIGYYNSGSGGLLEARYFPGVVTNLAGGGSQPVPFANQIEINPGKTPQTQLQVDAAATLTTSGFTAETVAFTSTSTTTAGTSTLIVDNVTAGPNSTTIPAMSTIQVLSADASFTGSIAKLDIASNKIVNVTQSIGVNANSTLQKLSGGTLLINTLTNTGTTTSPGKLSINAGVVGGTGTLTVGSVIVNSGSGVPGGIISAGTSKVLSGPSVADATGVLTTLGSQTWTGGAGNTGGTYAWKLNVNNVGAAGGSLNNDKTGANWDQLTVNSLTVSASASSPFNIEIISLGGSIGNSFSVANSYSWTVANTTGAITGFSASAFHVDTSNFLNPATTLPYTNLGFFGVSTVVDSTFNDVVVNYSPAPEPTSLALLGMGAAGMMLRRRRAITAPATR